MFYILYVPSSVEDILHNVLYHVLASVADMLHNVLYIMFYSFCCGYAA